MGLLNRNRGTPPTDTLAPYVRQVEKLLKQMRIEPTQARQLETPGHLWRFRYGSAQIEVALFHKRADEGGGDMLQVYSPLIHLPQSGLLALYRRLLELNLSMSQVAFGVRDDVVYLFLERSLTDLETRELEGHIKAVAGAADRYDNELASEFGARLYHHT